MTKRSERLETQSGKFWALSHPGRLRVLQLTATPKTLDELADALSTTRQAVSKHVRVLRDASLLQDQAGRRQREVREHRVDPAALFALSGDLARLVEDRFRGQQLLALPTHPGAADVADGSPPPRSSPSLVVVRFADIHARFPLQASPGRKWSIGRSARCEVSLPHDKRISAQHALLRYETRGFSIADLESRNGTFVNGERLASGPGALLALGDIVRLGDTVLVLQ